MPKKNLTRQERKKYATIEFTEKEIRFLLAVLPWTANGGSVHRKIAEAKPRRKEKKNVNDD